MRWPLASFFCVVMCIHTNAQSGLFVFTRYTSANGLADNLVNNIVQDSRGFMWFGTREGLSRFDGTGFQNFFARKNDSTAMPGNSIRGLFEYAPNQLIMTSDGRLTTMNTITKQFHRVKEFQNKGIQYINRIEKGLYTINNTDTCFLTTDHLKIIDTLIPPFRKTDVVATINPISDKEWLVGSLWEYFLYNKTEKTYKVVIPLNDMHDPQKMLTFQYYDEKQNCLYFSNYFNGLFRYSLDGQLLYNWKKGNLPSGIPDGNISFMIPKNDSILWIGGNEKGGINILNNRTNFITSLEEGNNGPSLASNAIYFHFKDRDGNEWISTSEGVSKLTNSIASIRSWDNEFKGLGENNVLLNLIKGSDGNMYVSVLGTNYSYRINSLTGNVSQLNKTELPNTWCMNSFGNELIFTGSTTITTFNPRTNQYRKTDFLKKFFPVSDIVILAFRHSNGDTWYSGNNGGGFVRLSANGQEIHQYKKSGPRGNFSVSYYSCYVEDKNGDLWFGVNKSSRLLHWNKKTDYFNEVSFDTVKGIARESLAGISDLTLDKDNKIWIAFDGAGIAKYDPAENSAEHFTLQDGLPTNYVYGLKFDNKNRLWIGTLKGLSCFLVKENRFSNFTREDGLPADYFDERCIYYDSTQNQLWAGSRNTLVRFDPDVLLQNTRRQFPIYIDEIIVNSKMYTGAYNQMNFSPFQNNLQFRFVGLDINTGGDIEYSYRLTGADKDWIYNGSILSASYANLDPGNYSFAVRARHKGEVKWKTMEAPVQFFIATPWYKTWWFGLLILALFVALTIEIIYSHFQRKLQKQNAAMERELAVEQERTELARDLHDGLGSMLSGIKHSFSAIRNQLTLDEEQSGNFSASIDKLNDSIREIRTISHSMASGTLLQSGLEDSLRDYCRDLNVPGGSKISFEFLALENRKFTGDQAFHIFRIIQELLQNVIKHSGAMQAIVQLSYNANRLYITVEDDGKGFELKEAALNNGFGLKNIQDRVKVLNGKMDVRTAPGRGTSILIEVPSP
jgi:signal transduction histidine kinase/ligand-binding sensor domain-containing protein